jgi:Fe-S-cluster containining protein
MILWPRICPALIKGKCSIYDIRPYPCRQFLCGKQSRLDHRPWKSDGSFNTEYFNWLLNNNKEFAKVKEKLEDKAADWGLKHNWNLRKIT